MAMRIETLAAPDEASPEIYETWASVSNTSPRGQIRPTTGQRLQGFDKNMPATQFLRRFLAYVNDQRIGCGVVRHTQETYDPHRYEIGVTVDPAAQRRGWGAALFDHAMAMLDPLEPRELICILDSGDLASLKFATDRGFQKDRTHVTSRLQLQPHHLNQDLGVPDGYRLLSLTALRDEAQPDWERRLWTLTSHVEHDLPSSFPVTPMAFEPFMATILNNPTLCNDTTTIALHGNEMVGLSSTWLRKGKPDFRYTGLTGVLRDHRRRGLALALKRRVMRRCYAQGIREILTENDASNPMLDINIMLGFEQVSALLVMFRALHTKT